MNAFSRFFVTAAALLLLPLPLHAQSDAPSNFDAVAKHLQTGGVFYSLIDIDGDLTKFASVGENLLDMAKHEAGGAIPPGLSAKGILKALGLERVKAIGMSSKATAGNLFHNRALVYIPEGRTGLFKLFGGEAMPLQSPPLAPAGSDFVAETELTLSALLEIAEALISSMGDENLLQQFKGMQGFPVPGLEMTAGDLVRRLNTHMVIAGRLEKNKTFTPPGAKTSLPSFRLVVTFDQIDFLFPPIMEYMKAAGNALVESGEGFELIRPKEAMPAWFESFRPVFYHDLKSKRLFLATHEDAVREMLAGKAPLSADPTFVKAMEGLPSKGNAFSYLTPAVFEAIDLFMKEIMDAAPSTPGAPSAEKIKALVEQWEKLFPAATAPMISIRSNLPEGMLFLSNSTSSYKSIFTVPVALAAGIAVGSFTSYQTIRAAVEQKRAGNAPEDTDSEETDREAGEAPEDDNSKTIRNNLKQIAFAAQSYFISNPEKTEVTYGQLITEDLLFQLKPVNGEKYDQLTLKKTGGSLSVESSTGAVRHSYTPAGK